MVNLLEETMKLIKEIGKNVAWIGSDDMKYQITLDRFKEIADVEYDPGFGGQEVVTDLIVVFVDGTYLDRHEYEGDEWWEYHSLIQTDINEGSKDIQSLVTKDAGWETIESLNQESTDVNLNDIHRKSLKNS